MSEDIIILITKRTYVSSWPGHISNSQYRGFLKQNWSRKLFTFIIFSDKDPHQPLCGSGSRE